MSRECVISLKNLVVKLSNKHGSSDDAIDGVVVIVYQEDDKKKQYPNVNFYSAKVFSRLEHCPFTRSRGRYQYAELSVLLDNGIDLFKLETEEGDKKKVLDALRDPSLRVLFSTVETFGTDITRYVGLTIRRLRIFELDMMSALRDVNIRHVHLQINIGKYILDGNNDGFLKHDLRAYETDYETVLLGRNRQEQLQLWAWFKKIYSGLREGQSSFLPKTNFIGKLSDAPEDTAKNWLAVFEHIKCDKTSRTAAAYRLLTEHCISGEVALVSVVNEAHLKRDVYLESCKRSHPLATSNTFGSRFFNMKSLAKQKYNSTDYDANTTEGTTRHAKVNRVVRSSL